ncbi:tetrahydromethanopterin-linked C1 transfer pathway [Stieleria sp. JC731]|uniref:hydantoinase/oxoprolinase family protein n=1 Tax=Pirellulaceae TaxID=2691357 RepID=UPI001E59160C|nr:hydantoinase/oxoprolinase family protein [Stieleria sp. JC731]MCC9599988.1 tetrahydromethanopterin-linked C1 transfer pathway [Stieleria sp. JC731]
MCSTYSPVVGIDIGGANLKYAHSSGVTLAVDFPLWRKSDCLATQLINDLAILPPHQMVVVTMTGELADCFLDREVGVKHIVGQTQLAAQRSGVGLQIYGVGGGWYTDQTFSDQTDRIAAANWHALASHASSYLPSGRTGLLIDIGSTTTDLIPIINGQVATGARTDFDRLCEGSLVYVGGQRTPVSSIVNELTFRNRQVPIMREVFSTMDDVRLLLGLTKESRSCETADGKPRDLFHAANRIARMIGLGHREVSLNDAANLAAQVFNAATELIDQGIRKLFAQYDMHGVQERSDDGHAINVIVSGHADDLVPKSLLESASLLSDHLGPEQSRCATAIALTRLWEQQVCDAS